MCSKCVIPIELPSGARLFKLFGMTASWGRDLRVDFVEERNFADAIGTYVRAEKAYWTAWITGRNASSAARCCRDKREGN